MFSPQIAIYYLGIYNQFADRYEMPVAVAPEIRRNVCHTPQAKGGGLISASTP